MKKINVYFATILFCSLLGTSVFAEAKVVIEDPAMVAEYLVSGRIDTLDSSMFLDTKCISARLFNNGSHQAHLSVGYVVSKLEFEVTRYGAVVPSHGYNLESVTLPQINITATYTHPTFEDRILAVEVRPLAENCGR